MKKTVTLIGLILIIAVILTLLQEQVSWLAADASGSMAPAHTVNDGNSGTVRQGALEVTLTIDRDVYTSGRPVTLSATIEVVNCSDTRVDFRNMEAEDVALVVLDAAGHELYRWTPGWLLVKAARLKSLRPGKSMDMNRKIRLEGDGGSSLRPGRYAVVAAGVAMPSRKRYEIRTPFAVVDGS